MITLDGSYGEGGGALVRTALALSTYTGKPFTITNIRAGRSQPGLKAQHVAAITALKDISAAETSEYHVGCTELSFTPGKVKSGKYTIAIGTAGSISLLLQGILLPCLFASGKVTLNISGGTCGKWQASVDYIQNILLPYVKRFVQNIEMKILKRGYYPKGGGEIELAISPSNEVSPHRILLTEQGVLEQIRGIVNCSRELQEKHIGERIQTVAESLLKKSNVPVSVRIEYAQSMSVGGEFLLWGVFSKNNEISTENPVVLSGSALLEKRKSSEDIAKEAANAVLEEIASGAAVDHYLGDQLLLFMALLPGSRIYVSTVSEHARTNIHVIEQFLPVKFHVEGRMIRVESI